MSFWIFDYNILTVFSTIFISSQSYEEYPVLRGQPGQPEVLAGVVQSVKQRRGKRGGLRAKLQLTPHKLSLSSIFLANDWSLANKMIELRLQITQNRRLVDYNIMTLMETWLHSGIPC